MQTENRQTDATIHITSLAETTRQYLVDTVISHFTLFFLCFYFLFKSVSNVCTGKLSFPNIEHLFAYTYYRHIMAPDSVTPHLFPFFLCCRCLFPDVPHFRYTGNRPAGGLPPNMTENMCPHHEQAFAAQYVASHLQQHRDHLQMCKFPGKLTY